MPAELKPTPVLADADAIHTVDEVAAMLGCTPRSVRERARRHELPGLKFGGDWCFPRKALFEYLNALALKWVQLQPRPPAPPPMVNGVVVPRKRGRPRRTPAHLPDLPHGLS